MGQWLIPSIDWRGWAGCSCRTVGCIQGDKAKAKPAVRSDRDGQLLTIRAEQAAVPTPEDPDIKGGPRGAQNGLAGLATSGPFELDLQTKLQTHRARRSSPNPQRWAGICTVTGRYDTPRHPPSSS
jgi:hypothetical protein